MDSPPNCVNSVQFQFPHHSAYIASASTDEYPKVILYMINIAYYFLMCLREYKRSNYPTILFQLNDVSLICGAVKIHILQTPVASFKTSTYGKLEFTTPNNAIQEEVVGHSTSGDALM